jgi:hypothetical protein
VSPTHKRCITSRRESKIQVMPTPHSRAMAGSSGIATRTLGHDQRLRHFTPERKTIRAATPPASRIQATSLHWGQNASRATSVKPSPMTKDSSPPPKARRGIPNKKRTLW